MWTWVGLDAFAGAGPDPGVVRGSGSSEGQSPSGNAARVPTDDHDTQSCVEKMAPQYLSITWYCGVVAVGAARVYHAFVVNR